MNGEHGHQHAGIANLRTPSHEEAVERGRKGGQTTSDARRFMNRTKCAKECKNKIESGKFKVLYENKKLELREV